VFIDDPDSVEAEAYRRLRTNLRGATTDSGRRSILITSAVSGEGKTLITANLGLAFAQTGQKVVLVDADMRQPGLGRLFNMEETRGLADVLAGESLEDIVLRETELPLQIVTSGLPERNPAELLESSRFREVIEELQSDNDLVIVDSPALLPVSDAAAMARACAAILIVARVSSTHAEELDIAVDSLRTVGRRPIGAILNDSSARMGPAYTYERRRVRDDARSAAPASGG
jgi:capsular exopolysaccharide synthesis family protein